MRTNFLSVLIISILSYSSLSSANEACLLEANTMMMGIQLDIKDCIQNAGLAEKDFKSQCQGMSQAAVSMGGPAAKITYLASCPTSFQAKCDNTKTAKTIFFYYKRAADEAAGIKSGCELMQGVYTNGTFQ